MLLPSRPSSATSTNVFEEIWTTHRSLGSLSINSKGQTPKFHTSKFVQGLEVDLVEHRKIANMFQHIAKYSVQMTNILFRLLDLEIRNKQIIKEKNRYIQNLQGVLEKEQKFKA